MTAWRSKITIAVIFLTGLSILLYPTVSDYMNERHSSQAIATYEESVNELPEEEYAREFQKAAAYNEYLAGLGDLNVSAAVEQGRGDSPYEELLDVGGNGIMAVVRIPSIDVQLPVYHGTDEGILRVAAGHFLGSSLPIGGESTHSLITGHRGLPSAKLFTDLDRLEEGDVFYIKVLGDILKYQIDQIQIVLPTELDSLSIKEGEDYVTLVTCTPYGINSHRILVRGTRVPYDGNYEKKVPVKTASGSGNALAGGNRGRAFSTRQWGFFGAAVFAAAIFLGILLPKKRTGEEDPSQADRDA